MNSEPMNNELITMNNEPKTTLHASPVPKVRDTLRASPVPQVRDARTKTTYYAKQTQFQKSPNERK